MLFRDPGPRLALTLAWLNLLIFCGLGVAVLAGVQIPEDPDCYGRCMLDTMAGIQKDFGSGKLAVMLFASGFGGYVWYLRMHWH